ncbi:MAG: AMP-binding protein, partial [Pseudomonadota bacterium]
MQFHPTYHAVRNPDRPAIIMAGSGLVVTYGELDAVSNRFAHAMRARGLQIGDTIALCLENTADLFTVAWGAQRAGLIYVAVSNRLTAPEVAYIARDSGSRLIIGSACTAPLLDEVSALAPDVPQMRFGSSGDRSLDAVLA